MIDNTMALILAAGGIVLLIVLLVLPIGNKRALENCKAHGGEKVVGSRQPFCITSDGRIVVW